MDDIKIFAMNDKKKKKKKKYRLLESTAKLKGLNLRLKNVLCL